MKKQVKALMTATAVASLMSTSAMAASMTASQWLPQSYAQSIHAYKNMFDSIREQTQGDIDVEVFYGGSLLPAKTTIQGVRDGVADIGLVYPAYTPAELPVNSFLNSANFASKDSLAAALAYTELGFTNSTLMAEFDKYNVVFTGAFVTPSYLFMCNQEVNDLNEAKGKRFRTAGAAYTGLADKLNATAVSVPIGDVYSGMQRGNLDCVIADPTNLIAASFNEVVTDITSLSMGGATGLLWAINKDSWAKLSTSNRQLLLDQMVYGMIATHAEWNSQVDAAYADAAERGIKVSAPNADLNNTINEYTQDFIGNVVATSENVENPQALFDDFIAKQQKWGALLANVDRNDINAVAELVRKELLGNVDTATFGLK